MSRLAHNNAVQNNKTQKARINYDGFGKVVEIRTGHLDGVDVSDAIDFAKEIDSEIHKEVDQMAVHEHGGGGIGYAEVQDDEFIGFTVYGQYK